MIDHPKQVDCMVAMTTALCTITRGCKRQLSKELASNTVSMSSFLCKNLFMLLRQMYCATRLLLEES